MTIQEKKDKLIQKYNVKQAANIANYNKKIAGMTSAQIEQEYSIVILGKEYKQPKKKKKGDREEVTYKKAKKEDLESSW